MRRVLIVDDPCLAPRLHWLRATLGEGWDLMLSPAEQVTLWTESGLTGPGGQAAALPDVESLIPVGEAVTLTVAASIPESLKVASRLAFRRGSQVRVLPEARQAADWIFSLYPLSEGETPRVRGVWTHRESEAVRVFKEQLPESLTARHLVLACTVPGSTLTADQVEKQFVDDIDLLRDLAGEFNQLYAVEIPGDEPGLSRSVFITLRGEGAGSVSWVLTPGARSSWVMKRQEDGSGSILTRTADGGLRLGGSCDGPPTPGIDPGLNGCPFAPWQDVLRAFDDLAALRRSLRKRRQVELQTEIVSEQAQFKSIMSASGCGLLLATLFGAVALLAAGAAFDPRPSQQLTSERAGLVLQAADFRPGTSELTDETGAEWPAMVRRLGQTAAPILIQKTEDTSLDQARRDRVVSMLTESGLPGAGSRVEVYELRGALFVKLLKACWVILFLPLGLFLAVQALLLAAPAVNRAGPGSDTAPEAD
jgi:hypothetical protein